MPRSLLSIVFVMVALATLTLFGGNAMAGPGADEPSAESGSSAGPEADSGEEAEAPAATEGSGGRTAGWSGPGFYLSVMKILACWLVFLVWVASTDWLSRDCQATKMGYIRWNPIVVGTFMLALLLVFVIPLFVVGFPLLVIAFVAPLSTYVIIRNKQVEKQERVFTPDHIRHWMTRKFSPKAAAAQVEAGAADPHETGPPVILTARGAASERDDRANLLAARQAPGFRSARVVVADGMSRRADAIMLDYTQQGVGVRYQVDGVWHNGEPLERETADPMLEALKTLCGLNWEDRQNRQQGAFMAEFEAANYAATFASQGTKTGERTIMQFEGKKTRFDTLESIGMRAKMQEELQELLRGEKGLLLLSAPQATGLRSTTNVVLRAMDRLVRDFVSVEDEKNRYEDVENIKVVTYNGAAGETPNTVLRKVFLEEPEVVIVRDLVDAETVSRICEEISSVGRLLISTIRAKDCAEAMLRVLAMKVTPAEFAESVTAVLSQRLIRKLCEHCREAYVPTPQVLKQLGIPQGRVDVFYRPPQQTEEVCEVCGGIGYIGRTAIFELLSVDDAVRNALASTPKADPLRQAARNAKMRTLQEEGIVLVVKGLTSLPELMRVLKQ
ncbi:MAG: Flp pilus assembly complex ATPase component TadA [Planctomycetes bacterium]|nr:Flp pilus assembly complex ATPase component TadA [Planctomycetota bacterium]